MPLPDTPPKSFFQLFYKRIKENFIEAIVSLSVAVVSVTAATIATSSKFRVIDNPALANKEQITFYVTIALGVLIVTTIIIFFVLIIRRRTAQSSQLRKKVSEAFISALDRSSFNPSQKVKKLDVQSTN
jgi:uncharacterized membrane protein